MSENVVGGGLIETKENIEYYAFNRRFILFSVALLANLVERLVSLMGPVVKRQIYEVAFTSGKIAGDRMREYFKGGIGQVEKHVDMIKGLGWGKMKEIKHEEATGKVTIDFFNSWESSGYSEVQPDQKSENPVCILSAGMYAGAITGAFDTMYECEEVLCRNKGDEVCRFEFTPATEKRKIIR